MRIKGRSIPDWLNLRNVLIVASAARLSTLLWLRTFFHPNCFEWGDTVRKYLEGRGFSYFTVNGIDVPTAYMPPAYSFILLTTISIFGDRPFSYLLLQVVQAGLGVFLVYLVFRFTRIAFSEETAIVAAVLVAIYPPFVYMPVEMHSINFYIILTVAVAYYVFLFLQSAGTATHLVWAGFLLGILLYFRAEALAWPVLFAALVTWKRPQNWRAAMLILVLPAVLLSPWVIRNYKTFNYVIPGTTAGGINLWYGHNPRANGTQHEMWPSGRYLEADGELQRKFDALVPTVDYELRRSDIYRDEAVRFIRTHPAREVELAFWKCFYFWTLDWNHPKARVLAYAFPALLLVALFWMGVWLNRKDLRSRHSVSLILILFTALLAMVFFVLPRYRLVIEPLMIPFSASAILWVSQVLLSYSAKVGLNSAHEALAAE
nr:hypothetical protein Hi04_10k_c4773_00025 [uncultured bacterium]